MGLFMRPSTRIKDAVDADTLHKATDFFYLYFVTFAKVRLVKYQNRLYLFNFSTLCINIKKNIRMEVTDNDKLFLQFVKRGRDSSGSIASDYGLDDRAIGVRSPAGAKDFSSSLCVQTGSGAHPASCIIGTGGPFPGGKSAGGCNADHSPPSSAEVENE
jgi:hypothetical protein